MHFRDIAIAGKKNLDSGLSIWQYLMAYSWRVLLGGILLGMCDHLYMVALVILFSSQTVFVVVVKKYYENKRMILARIVLDSICLLVFSYYFSSKLPELFLLVVVPILRATFFVKDKVRYMYWVLSSIMYTSILIWAMNIHLLTQSRGIAYIIFGHLIYFFGYEFRDNNEKMKYLGFMNIRHFLLKTSLPSFDYFFKVLDTYDILKASLQAGNCFVAEVKDGNCYVRTLDFLYNERQTRKNFLFFWTSQIHSRWNKSKVAIQHIYFNVQPKFILHDIPKNEYGMMNSKCDGRINSFGNFISYYFPKAMSYAYLDLGSNAEGHSGRYLLFFLSEKDYLAHTTSPKTKDFFKIRKEVSASLVRSQQTLDMVEKATLTPERFFDIRKETISKMFLEFSIEYLTAHNGYIVFRSSDNPSFFEVTAYVLKESDYADKWPDKWIRRLASFKDMMKNLKINNEFFSKITEYKRNDFYYLIGDSNKKAARDIAILSNSHRLYPAVFEDMYLTLIIPILRNQEEIGMMILHFTKEDADNFAEDIYTYSHSRVLALM